MQKDIDFSRLTAHTRKEKKRASKKFKIMMK